MEEDRLVERAGADRNADERRCSTSCQRSHPSVGAVRSIGLFGIVELVRTARPDTAGAVQRHVAGNDRVSKFFRQEGLYTFVRWNTFFTNPPLSITEDELREGFAIINKSLSELSNRVIG